MAKTKEYKPKSTPSQRSRRPALSQEAREMQLIALATDLAEQQLLDGTASSQVITHFLKQGTARAELEKEKIRKENLVLEAKAKSLEDAKETRALFEEAMKVFAGYSGQAELDDEEWR